MAALAIALVAIPAAPALAQDVTEVSNLLALPDEFDQQIVTIRGEIVGDYGVRTDVVWVQVNDDPYVDEPLAVNGRLAGTNTGISVRLSGEVPPAFGSPGGHGVRGPIVEITGVFRDLDPTLGGLTYIEATDVELVARSERLPESGASTAATVAGAVLTVLGLLALAQRRDLLRPRGHP